MVVPIPIIITNPALGTTNRKKGDQNTQMEKTKLIAASLSIFDNNNQVNDSEMLNLWNKLVEEGADGIFIGGSVGECFLLKNSERIHMFEEASRFAASTNRPLDIYAHVGALSTDEAIEMARAAKSAGIKHIASTPPFYFSLSRKEVAHYYYDLASAINDSVLYYDIPSSTHIDLNTDDPDIQSLLKSGVISANKHTNLQSYRVNKIKSQNPNITMFGGFESRVIPMMGYHCNGFIGSTFNFMLPQYRKIIEVYHSSQSSKVYRMVQDTTSVLNVLVEVGLPAAIKYILASRYGIQAGEVRRPLLPLTLEAKKKIDEILNQKLFDVTSL